MKDNPDLQDIVAEWLKANNYDGLCNTDTGCGCSLEDFMPCSEPGINCEAGHIDESENDDYDFIINPGKKPKDREEVSRET